MWLCLWAIVLACSTLMEFFFKFQKVLKLSIYKKTTVWEKHFYFSYLIVGLNVLCVVVRAFSMLSWLSGNHKVVSFRNFLKAACRLNDYWEIWITQCMFMVWDLGNYFRCSNSFWGYTILFWAVPFLIWLSLWATALACSTLINTLYKVLKLSIYKH